MWKDRVIFGKRVDAGISYVYDVGRIWLAIKLDERMSDLHRRHRRMVARKISENGWDSGTVLATLEEHLGDLHVRTDVAHIRELAYLEVGHDDEEARVNGLTKVLIEAKLASVLDHVCKGKPGTDEDRGATGALERARQFRDKVGLATDAREAAAQAAAKQQLDMPATPQEPDPGPAEDQDLPAALRGVIRGDEDDSQAP